MKWTVKNVNTEKNVTRKITVLTIILSQYPLSTDFTRHK